MNTNDYEKALESAGEELVELLTQKEEIETRIAQLKQTIRGLSSLTNAKSPWSEFLTELESEGITERCRQILIASNRPLTPVEVRNRLIAAIPDYQQSANLLASVHTVLKRFVKANETKTRASPDGSVAYQWIRRFPREKVKSTRNAVVRQSLEKDS